MDVAQAAIAPKTYALPPLAVMRGATVYPVAVVVVANLLLPQEVELPSLSLPQELHPQAVEGAPQPQPQAIARFTIVSQTRHAGQAMGVGRYVTSA
jgi:hypothetical protein